MKEKLNLYDYIAAVQDFPKEGILFRDITPLMQNGKAFNQACSEFVKFLDVAELTEYDFKNNQ